MAASTPRKTTTRKAAPRKRASAKAPADLGIVLDDPAAQAEIEELIADREPLFTIGETTYTIPKEVPPSWSLQAFQIATTDGESAALAFAARKLLTEDAWHALVHCETVSKSAMRAVLKALMDKVLPDGVLGPKA